MRPALLVLSTLLAFGLAGPASAQENGIVTGVVVARDTGIPLAGTAVRLVEVDRAAGTDAAGRFRFGAVPAGSHTLEVVSLGRVVERRAVDVRPGATRSVEFALAPIAVAAPEIRVVLDRLRTIGSRARAAEIAGSAHFIGPQELAELPGVFDDVHDVLRTVPGVYVQEEEGYGLRPNVGLRGTGSERSSKITLMEDGVLIAPAPYAAPAAYYFPMVGRMEAVEIRKGSSQIQYGPSTIGGALNLISSPIPEMLSWQAELEGGSDETGKAWARIGDSYENFGWLGETYQLRTGGFKRLDGGGDTGFEIHDYLVKGRVRTDPDAALYQELELKLHRYDEVSRETYLGLTDADFEADPVRRYAASQADVMNAEQTQVALRHFLRPAAALDLTTVAYRNAFQRNWYKLDSVLGEGIANVLDDPQGFPAALAILRGGDSPDDALALRANNREYTATGVQSILGLRFDAGVPHQAEIGVRYHEDDEDRFQHDDAYRMAGGEMVLTTAGAPGSQSNRVSEARAWSLFVQDEIDLGRWTVVPGLRYETIDFTRTDYAGDDPGRIEPTGVRQNDVSAWIPGVGATWALRDDLRLFGGVHRGFGPPGPGADAETESERSVNWELGVKLDRDALSAQVAGFYSDYDNILGRATLAVGDDAGSGEVFNGGAVEVAGVEAALDLDAGRITGGGFGIPVRVAWTWTRAEFRSGFESDFEPWGTVEAGDGLPYLPEQQLSASVGLERGPWDGRVTLQASSAMRTVAGRGPIPAGQGTDAFGVWSLAVGYAVAPWAKIQAGVENLSDEVYVVARRPAGVRPGLPRTFQAGIRLAR
ncbi:MAG TPA: TonB-dependent receptor [Gemmatimonadota bacterium]|nr:TonB-dependent receptor [Gemmatimonadota bacterium]